MSLRRLNRPIKTLAQKGTPGTPRRRISILVSPAGIKFEWHPTKGFRRWA